MGVRADSGRYEYVKNFERDEIILPNMWIVVRIDGRGFHKSVSPVLFLSCLLVVVAEVFLPSLYSQTARGRSSAGPLLSLKSSRTSWAFACYWYFLTEPRLSNHYSFTKPNDSRALNLMNATASKVVSTMPEICIAYGVSDEYSFVFHKSTTLFERRAAKLVTTIVSTFTAFYAHLWANFMEDKALEIGFLPTFDGRAVCYPSIGNLRDYLRWRQVDSESSVYPRQVRVLLIRELGHINNLYNTTFWAMINNGGYGARDAENELKGSVSIGKRNEILWSRYGINYNNEPEMFRKGSVVFREYELDDTPRINGSGNSQVEQNLEPESSTEVPEEAAVPSNTQAEKSRKAKAKAKAMVVVEHVDIINDTFWEKRPWILSGKPGKPVLRDQP